MKKLKTTDLQAIRYNDNHEPLVNLATACSEILCDYRRTDSEIREVLVRQSIADKLKNVQKKLPQKMKLQVVEGYRSPAYQERYYLKELLIQQKKNPLMNFTDLLEHVYQFVALPSVAGHPTGGAIDLTIAFDGEELYMGGKIANFSVPELLPTYSDIATLEQKKWRMLLHDLMVAERFCSILRRMVAFFLW